jgi:hypothetical protein
MLCMEFQISPHYYGTWKSEHQSKCLMSQRTQTHWTFLLHGRHHHQYMISQYAATVCSPISWGSESTGHRLTRWNTVTVVFIFPKTCGQNRPKKTDWKRWANCMASKIWWFKPPWITSLEVHKWPGVLHKVTFVQDLKEYIVYTVEWILPEMYVSALWASEYWWALCSQQRGLWAEVY